MTDDIRKYGNGTELRSRMPWGIYTGGSALCADGKVRKLAKIAQTADTFFSIPAAVRVHGKTVSGYVTVETLEGWSTASENDPAAVKFIAYGNGKNAKLLPFGAYRKKGPLAAEGQ